MKEGHNKNAWCRSAKPSQAKPSQVGKVRGRVRHKVQVMRMGKDIVQTREAATVVVVGVI